MGSINVVTHNLQGMFSNRQLGIVHTNKKKSTEKLSSGYKINRAADDAAGAVPRECLWTDCSAEHPATGLSAETVGMPSGVQTYGLSDGISYRRSAPRTWFFGAGD